GAPRLVPVPGAVRDRRGDVEHEVQLEDRRELRVEDAVLVREPDRTEAVPQLCEHAAGVREGGLFPENADVPFHQLLHLDPDSGYGLLAALAAEQAVEDPGLFFPEGLPGRRAPGVA